MPQQTRTNLAALCQQLPDILMPEAYIRGVIFAVSAAPEIPMPQTWFAWVFNQHGQLTDNQQADHLADTLMDSLKHQLDMMRKQSAQQGLNEWTPPYPLQQPLDATQPISIWLTGLLFAHSQLESVWQSAWQAMQQSEHADMPAAKKQLQHCLSMFSTFADIPLALRQAEQRGQAGLLEKLPVIFRSMSSALANYVKLSGELVEHLPNQFEQF